MTGRVSAPRWHRSSGNLMTGRFSAPRWCRSAGNIMTGRTLLRDGAEAQVTFLLPFLRNYYLNFFVNFGMIRNIGNYTLNCFKYSGAVCLNNFVQMELKYQIYTICLFIYLYIYYIYKPVALIRHVLLSIV